MNALILDTSTPDLKVRIIKGDSRINFEIVVGKHTVSIISAIDNALKQSKLMLDDLDSIGVVVGPGSYTGIRIGCAVANAFNLAKNIPLIEITSLEYPLFNRVEGWYCLFSGHDYYAAHRILNVIKYSILTKDEYENISGYLVENDENLIFDTFLEKYKSKKFVPSLTPFYMKKPSAETGV